MNDGPQWEPAQTPAPQPTAPAPMRLGQVFEVGRRILVRHWSVLLLIALLFTGPGALLSSATALRFTEVAIDLFLLSSQYADIATLCESVNRSMETGIWESREPST